MFLLGSIQEAQLVAEGASMPGLGLQQALCPLTAPQGLPEALGGHAWPPRGFCSMHRASLPPSFPHIVARAAAGTFFQGASVWDSEQ